MRNTLILKYMITIVYMSGYINAYSQDSTFFKNNQSPLYAKVIGITEWKVKYKDPNGSKFRIRRDDIVYIRYQNGDMVSPATNNSPWIEEKPRRIGCLERLLLFAYDNDYRKTH